MPQARLNNRQSSSASETVSGNRAAMPGPVSPARRRMLAGLAGSVAFATWAVPALAQDDASAPADQPVQGDAAAQPAPEPKPVDQSFNFQILVDQMKAAAGQAMPKVTPVDGFFGGLGYDDYRQIQFDPERARWKGEGELFQVNAFAPGWLYKETVDMYEVADGKKSPMGFSAEDFLFHDPLGKRVPGDLKLPGVAGFRLNAPLNRADIFDEVISFLGASYFRGLGRDCTYGLSARGLAVNTAQPSGEEFPRFSAFYLERPAKGAKSATLYAALESDSLTGAYRFVVTPGENTVVDVDAKLFLRKDVGQLGIAPLTSMFLFGDADMGKFDDYRKAVHDSDGLVLLGQAGETFYRPLKNPPRLASSYLGAENPVSFGLVQRARDYDDYLDAEGHYQDRPSLMIEPKGDWGKGFVRLVEIPSDLEANDNIAAFWVPDRKFAKGDEIDVSYRMRWGRKPGSEEGRIARVIRTLSGQGGIPGDKPAKDSRKFIIDFRGGLLSELPADAEVKASVKVDKGQVNQKALHRVEGSDTWRLITEIAAPDADLIEINASLSGYGQQLTETWLYQWMKE